MSCPHGSSNRDRCPDCADESNRISHVPAPAVAVGCQHLHQILIEAAYDGVRELRYTGLRISEPHTRERLEWAVRWCSGCGAVALGEKPPFVWRMPG